MFSDNSEILIGNSFPFSLVRRRMIADPASVAELQNLLPQARVHSFWGHANTVAAASAMLGVELKPEVERPVITLNAENLPMFAGRCFSQVWLLSCNYVSSFRPAIGEEVPAAMIHSWQILRLQWP